jgi:hypothetical protein
VNVGPVLRTVTTVGPGLNKVHVVTLVCLVAFIIFPYFMFFDFPYSICTNELICLISCSSVLLKREGSRVLLLLFDSKEAFIGEDA